MIGEWYNWCMNFIKIIFIYFLTVALLVSFAYLINSDKEYKYARHTYSPGTKEIVIKSSAERSGLSYEEAEKLPYDTVYRYKKVSRSEETSDMKIEFLKNPKFIESLRVQNSGQIASVNNIIVIIIMMLCAMPSLVALMVKSKWHLVLSIFLSALTLVILYSTNLSIGFDALALIVCGLVFFFAICLAFLLKLTNR